MSCHIEIGDPLEASGVGLAFSIRLGFQALNDRDRVLDVFGIDIGDMIDPAKFLHGFGLGPRQVAQMILRRQREQGIELFVDRGQILFLQDNQVFSFVTPDTSL